MLSVAGIKRLKPEDKVRKYADERGLYLEIRPTGAMIWRMKYRLNGKENTHTIGDYRFISLADARRKREEAKQLLTDGIDPNEAKKKTNSEQAGENTFNHVAMEWYNKRSSAWAASNSKKVLARLNKDILPFLGKRTIAEINAPELLTVIRRIESRSIDTAYRALQECGQIFRYGMATGKNNHDPSTALKGALSPNPKGNFAAITNPDQVGGMLRAFDGFNGTFVVKCALLLAPMFFVRIGELRTAKWADIDFERKQWTYYVTKTKHDHIVPLSSQAIAILRELQQLTGQYEHVFIGARDPKKPMSNGAINAALRRMGFDTQEEITGHGFRAMARTILRERLGFDRDVIEKQLAHATSEKLGTSYDRSDFIDQRTPMMQRWADYLDGLKHNVIQFPKQA